MECLDVCVVNASIIHKCLKPSEKMTLTNFKRVYSRPYCVLRNTEKISSGPKYGQHIYQKKRPGFPLKSDKINQTTYLIWEGECCVEIIAAPKKSHTELNGTALCAMLASEKLANIEGPI